MLRNGHLVMNRILGDAAGAGFALQEMDSAGRVTKLFDEDTFDRMNDWNLRRVLFARQNGDLWVAHPFNSVIDLYGPDRTKRKSYVRVADWLKPLAYGDRPSDGMFDRPPTSMMTGIWEDTTGLVWTLTLVPSPAWTPGPSFADWRAGQLLDTGRERLNTLIEAFDPANGKLVASLRLQPKISYALRDGYIAGYRETADGTPLVDVWQLQLKRPKQELKR
jgi:hypothetical protein